MEDQIKLIEILAKAAAELNVEIMMIGAYARDYWIKRWGLPESQRATYDVDFAVQVCVWEDFQNLLGLLKDEPYGLKPDKSYNHKLWLRDESLDIVPCGGIAQKDGMIVWPPHFDTQLCVYAYDIAAQDSEIASFGDCEIRVVKPYWLILLKLQSFICNPCDARDRDLQDVIFLIRHYWDSCDLESRVYAENGMDKDILESEEFNITLGGAGLMIRDCLRSNRIATEKIIQSVRDYNRDDQLVTDLARASGIDSGLAIRILRTITEAQ